MAIKFDAKDPDEIVLRTIEWDDRISTYTVDSSTWIVPTGITKDDDDFDDTSTTIKLSGGTEGVTYSLVNRVVLSSGEILDQTVKIKVKTK